MTTASPAETELRAKVLALAAEHAALAHAKKPFVPGQTPVPVSGRVFGPEDVATLVDASLDFWLTTGRYNDLFEKELGKFLGVPCVLTSPMPTLEALRMSAVDTLLVHDAELRAQRVPVDAGDAAAPDALIAAAWATGARVRVVPGLPGMDDGVGALLRFPVGAESDPA